MEHTKLPHTPQHCYQCLDHLLYMGCFTCLCAASHTTRVHIPASSTSTIMTDLAVPPPFQKPRSAPDIYIYIYRFLTLDLSFQVC